MNTYRRTLVYLASAVSLSFSVNSQAAFSIQFTNEQWPSLTVTGANGVYTNMPGIAYAWAADMHLDAFDDGRIKRWHFWPTVSNTQDHVAGKPVGPNLKLAGDKDSYQPMRPTEVHETINGILTTELNAWSVAQCNNLVQVLKDSGMEAEEIHAIDRHLAVEWQLKGSVTTYDPTPLGGGSFGYSKPVSTPMQSTITCESITPPTEVMGSADISLTPPDFELIDTDLSVFYTASGQCPKDILVSSSTRTNIQGQFKLWYEIQSANAGSLKSVNYTLGTGGAGDGGFVETAHMDTFEVPLTGLSQPGGGEMPGQVAGTTDMLPGVGAGGSGSGSVSPVAADDFNNAASTPVNEHSGKIRVVAQRMETPQSASPGGFAGELAAQTVASGWKDYHVTCEYDALPTIDNLPTDKKVDMDDFPGQVVSVPALTEEISNPVNAASDETIQRQRLREKARDVSRQHEIREDTAKRNLQAANKARKLQAEAEARSKALSEARKAAGKKRLAAIEARRKQAQADAMVKAKAKAKAKTEAEARRKALIAKQEQEAAKKLAAIETRKQRAANSNKRPKRLVAKKANVQLKATLKRHSN